ncbi:c-type cytochrome [Nevskia sp.]|uniref:c-type cytochrome n=1 Tax=Nevskia sp. TaxID=1929292 RepID=UPI003F6F9C81
MRTASLIASLLLATSSLAAHAAGDAQRGAEVFDNECSDCHTAPPKGGNGKGPALFGIVGRNAGSVAGYDYSDANKASHFVWTAEQLEAYLPNPKAAMPGTKMRYSGVKDAAERADVIAFLQSLK